MVGGVGLISTRPIPVIDPDNRGFDWETKVAFNAGIGLHIFFNRWLAATLEVRDYVFNDKLEIPQEFCLGTPYQAGEVLSSAAWDRRAKRRKLMVDKLMWDAEEGKLIATFLGHGTVVHTVSFNHDGTLLGSGGRDGAVRVWQIK